MAGIKIENTAIWASVEKIIKSTKKTVRLELRLAIHTEKEDIPVIKVDTRDVIADFTNNVADDIRVEFSIGLGDYVYRVLPFKHNLEATLKVIQLDDSNNSRAKGSTISAERYRVMMDTTNNPSLTGSEAVNYSMEELNKANIVRIQFQLVDRAAEVAKIKSVSGIFRKVTQEQMLLGLLKGEIDKIKVDGKSPIDGVDVVKPNNTEVKTHVIIPDGINLTSLPTWLHTQAGGIYNAGVGTYIRKIKDKKYWFVFPPYNTTRFKENVPKMIFYSVPSLKLGGIDKTFIQEGSTTHVICSGEKQYTDGGEVDLANRGVGFRLQEARSMMKKPVLMTEDGPKGSRTQSVHEVSAFAKDDQLNFAPVQANSSINPYINYGEVVVRNLARIDVTWDNADPSLIYPGMPCKYCFMDNEKLVELEGVIAFYHSLDASQSNSITGNLYKNTTALVILANRYSNKPSATKQKSFGVF